MSSTAERIDKIRKLPEQLKALVAGLTEEQLTTAYNAPEWTVAQNVHHVADSHMNSYIRFKLVYTEENAPLKGYDQDAWANLPDADKGNVDVSLALITSLHARWVMMLESFSEADWQKAGMHSEVGAYTLDRMLTTYANHGEAHLKQIQEVLDKMP